MAEVKPDVLPGLEAAYSNPLEEAQLKSLEARRIFEALCEAEPWMDDYWDLIAEGYSWRQALYMLWLAQPGDRRQPKTQYELATTILGLASDRALRDWRQDNPAFDVRVARLTASVLLKHRADVFVALAASAQNHNPRNHADRRMFLEMTGDYTPKQALGVGISASPVADLDEATLAAMAAIPAPDGEGPDDGN
jgi:hypothetical protein